MPHLTTSNQDAVTACVLGINLHHCYHTSGAVTITSFILCIQAFTGPEGWLQTIFKRTTSCKIRETRLGYKEFNYVGCWRNGR